MIFLNLLNYFLAFLKKIDRFIAKILIWTISLVRPLLGTENICPFEVGCTNFAIFNLEEQSVPLAAWAIFKKVSLYFDPLNNLNCLQWEMGIIGRLL